MTPGAARRVSPRSGRSTRPGRFRWSAQKTPALPGRMARDRRGGMTLGPLGRRFRQAAQLGSSIHFGHRRGNRPAFSRTSPPAARVLLREDALAGGLRHGDSRERGDNGQDGPCSFLRGDQRRPRARRSEGFAVFNDAHIMLRLATRRGLGAGRRSYRGLGCASRRSDAERPGHQPRARERPSAACPRWAALPSATDDKCRSQQCLGRRVAVSPCFSKRTKRTILAHARTEISCAIRGLDSLVMNSR